MKNLALLLTFGAALGAPLSASAAIPHGFASLPATSFSVADIGWEENPLDQLQAARQLEAVKPAVRAKAASNAVAQKRAAEASPAIPTPVPSSKPRDAQREYLIAQLLVAADSGFLAWR
jgi:hypothetical protein